MKSIILLSTVISIAYSVSSHPVLLMTIILTQTTLICILAYLKLKISWFSYILFLIFLGGLMVLFIYITSLASNELMNFSLKSHVMITMTTATLVSLAAQKANLQQMESTPTLFSKTFNFLYSFNTTILTLTAMVYLLFTLIVVVKVSNKFEAPISNLIFK